MRDLLVEMTGITKDFPGVHALADAGFELRAGEVHALVGENGAGKSTLMKILAGVYQPDAGEIRFEGEPVEIADPRTALGPRHQHHPPGAQPDAPPDGRPEHLPRPRAARAAGFLLDDGALNRQTQRADRAPPPASSIPSRASATSTVAQQQMVEIAKALSFDAAVLIMDEPTAALTDTEIDELFRIIRDLRAQRRRGRLHLAPDGGAQADRRPRHGDARRPLHRHAGDRRGGRSTDDHRHDGRPDDLRGGAGDPRDAIGRGRARGPRPRPAAGWCATSVFDLRARRDPRLRRAGRRGPDRGRPGRSSAPTGRSRARSGSTAGASTIRSPTDAVRHGIGYLSEDRKRYGLALGHGRRDEHRARLAAAGSCRRSAASTRRRHAGGRGAARARTSAIKTPSVRQTRPQPVRRQPAEGRHRQVADGRHRHPHLRRADARHRRRRQERDLPPAQRAGRARASRSS